MNESNKKVCFILFFLVILLSVFSATEVKAETGEELVADSWFYDIDSTVVNGNVYQIDIPSEDSEKILVDYEDGYYLIGSGDCESREITKICYVDKEYDSSDNKYKVRVKFYTISPVISVTRKIDDPSLAIGEKTEIDVEIKNEGLKDAEYILYKETLPEEIEVLSKSTEFIQEGQVLTWTGSLEKDNTKRLSYEIRAIDTGKIDYKANIVFDDGFTTREQNTDPLTATIDSSQELSLTSNATTIYIGDEIEVALILKNKQDKNHDVDNLELFIPENFMLTKMDDDFQKISDNSLTWSGELRRNQTKTFDFEFRSMFEGEQDFLAKAKVKKEDLTTGLEDELRIPVDIKELEILTLLDKDEEFDPDESPGTTTSDDEKVLESYQSGRLYVYIRNPYDNLILEDINLDLDSELTNIKNIPLDKLGPKNSKKLIERTIVAPGVTRKETKDLDFKATYKSEFRKDYSTAKTAEIKIDPIEDIYIDKDFSTRKPEAGDEITITVNIENERDVRLKDVYVRENLTESLNKKGLTSKKFDIGPEETIKAYTYTIKFPLSETKTYKLQTLVDYKDNIGEYSLIDQEDMKVKKRTPKIDFSKKFPDDIVMGSKIRPTYTIENDDTTTIQNLYLEFPKVKHGMHLDRYRYNISKLDAGDELTLSDAEMIIFFSNKTDIEIPKTTLHFEDLEGNRYSVESDEEVVDVEYASMQKPMLDVTVQMENKSTKKDSIKGTINVTNHGNRGTDFVLFKEHEKLTGSYISAGETKIFEFIHYKTDIGTEQIEGIYATFNDEPSRYFSMGNIEEVEFIDPEQAKEEDSQLDDTKSDGSNVTSESETDAKESSGVTDEIEEETINSSKSETAEKENIFEKIFKIFNFLVFWD